MSIVTASLTRVLYQVMMAGTNFVRQKIVYVFSILLFDYLILISNPLFCCFLFRQELFAFEMKDTYGCQQFII